MDTVSFWNDKYIERGSSTPWIYDTTILPPVKDLILSLENKDLKILEIGCGTGKHSLWIAEQGFNVIGLDISPKAIEEASNEAVKRSLTNITFISSDFLEVNFEENEFDIIIDINTLRVSTMSSNDRISFAKNISKFLKKDCIWLNITSKPNPDFPTIPQRDISYVSECAGNMFDLEIGDVIYPSPYVNNEYHPFEFWYVKSTNKK